jgi:hypothetical protein
MYEIGSFFFVILQHAGFASIYGVCELSVPLSYRAVFIRIMHTSRSTDALNNITSAHHNVFHFF